MARSGRHSGRSTLLWCGAVATTAVVVGSASAGQLALGPVSQVNLKASTIVVLGQTYHVGSSALGSKATSSVKSLASLAQGALVLVDGAETAKGSTTVLALTRLPQLNVPGATQLLVTGVVSAASNTGQIRVGKLNIDISATLTSDAAQVAVGDFVNVLGTQPTDGGIFVAQSLVRSDGIGVGGSGATIGVGGSGAAIGVGGSGSKIGVGGSGASIGVGGSGASLGVGGSGAAIGVGGSGSKIGVGGSGASIGVGGSGAALGVGGSGASLGVGGSGAAIGVGGSGSKIGVGGSGASIGVGGSGASIGVGGSGASLGVGGSGASLGVGGSGAAIGVGGSGSKIGVGGSGASIGVGGSG